MSEANSGPGRVTREQHGHLFLIGLDRAGKRQRNAGGPGAGHG